MTSSTQSPHFFVTLNALPTASADGPHCYEATAQNPTGTTGVWDIVKKVFETQRPFASYDITKDVTGVRVELLYDESQNVLAADWRGRICHLKETTLPTDGKCTWIAETVHPIQCKSWKPSLGKKSHNHVAILCRYIFSIKDRETLLITSPLFTNTRLYRYPTNRDRTLLSLQMQTIFLRFLQRLPSPSRRRITAADFSMKSEATFNDTGTEELASRSLGERIVHWNSYPRHVTPITIPKIMTRADGTDCPLEEYSTMSGTPVMCAEIAADDALLRACRTAAVAAAEKPIGEQRSLFSFFFALPPKEKAKLLAGEIRWAHEYLDAFRSTTITFDSKGQAIALTGEFEGCMERLSFLRKEGRVEQYAQQVQQAEKQGWTYALVHKADKDSKSLLQRACGPQPTNQLLIDLEKAFQETYFRKKALHDCYFEVQYLARCCNNLNTSLLTIKTVANLAGPDLLPEDKAKLKSKLGKLLAILHNDYAQLAGRVGEMWTIMSGHFTVAELAGLTQLCESGFPPESIDPQLIPLDDWMFDGKHLVPKDCIIT